MVFYKSTNCTLSHHVTKISWSIESEIVEFVFDLAESLCCSIVDYSITDRLMVVTAQDDDLCVADGRDCRLAAR